MEKYLTAKDVKLAIIDGGILHSLAALNLPTIRKVRMYVRNKSFIAFAYKIYECIVPVITKREILFFSSRFFSRTVLEFFWDSEEHDFHFHVDVQCTTSWKKTWKHFWGLPDRSWGLFAKKKSYFFRTIAQLWPAQYFYKFLLWNLLQIIFFYLFW